MEKIIALAIPFIALAILSVMIDKFTLFLEEVMHKVPRLPDKFEWPVAYAIVLGMSYVVCWQGNFSLFAHLDFQFWYEWEGWLLTALAVSGGSAFVRTQWGMIDVIPSGVMGITTTVKRMLPGRQQPSQQALNETVPPPDFSELSSSTAVLTGSEDVESPETKPPEIKKYTGDRYMGI